MNPLIISSIYVVAPLPADHFGAGLRLPIGIILLCFVTYLRNPTWLRFGRVASQKDLFRLRLSCYQLYLSEMKKHRVSHILSLG